MCSLTLSLEPCERNGFKLWQLVKVLRGKWDFRPIYDHHLHVRGHFGGLWVHTQMSNTAIFILRVIDCAVPTNIHSAAHRSRVLYHRKQPVCVLQQRPLVQRWRTDNDLCTHLFILWNSQSKSNKYLSGSNGHLHLLMHVSDLIGHWFPFIIISSYRMVDGL